ncbi:hypothetical protein HanPI659440_Chr13g0524511 [Helianthus annuus]|nr:hypothetical protein HanPI659440_Chr13g0524511 [Helianthus annuus]
MEQKRMLGSSWNDQMEVFELCECCNLNIAIYSAQRTSRSSQLSLHLIMDHGQVSLRCMGRVGGTHALLIDVWSFKCSKRQVVTTFCIWASNAARMEVPCVYNAGRLGFKYQASKRGGSRPAST